MKKASFHGSKIHKSNFTNSSLVETNFTDTDLQGTIFHNCDLSKSNFSNALNYIFDPRVNNIKGAKFSFSECINLLKAFAITIVYT